MRCLRHADSKQVIVVSGSFSSQIHETLSPLFSMLFCKALRYKDLLLSSAYGSTTKLVA